MSEYDPNTMAVYAGDGIYLVCSLCDEPFVEDDSHRMTMAELDTACQRHWREAHEHPNVLPM